ECPRRHRAGPGDRDCEGIRGVYGLGRERDGFEGERVAKEKGAARLWTGEGGAGGRSPQCGRNALACPGGCGGRSCRERRRTMEAARDVRTRAGAPERDLDRAPGGANRGGRGSVGVRL